MGDSESESDQTGKSETALLVQEYLRNHVRAEIKKQNNKYKKRRNRKQREKKQRMDETKHDDTFSLVHDRLSILSESPSNTIPEKLSFDHQALNSSGSMRIIKFAETKENEPEQSNFHVYVDKLGDSQKNVLVSNKSKPNKANY